MGFGPFQDILLNLVSPKQKNEQPVGLLIHSNHQLCEVLAKPSLRRFCDQRRVPCKSRTLGTSHVLEHEYCTLGRP